MENVYQGAYLPDLKFKIPSKPTFDECLEYFKEYLLNIPYFSKDDFNYLESYCEYFQLEKNKPLVLPGQTCQYIVFICKGAIKHYMEDAEGKYIINFATDGYFCSDIASFMNQSPSISGYLSVTNTFGLKISHAKFKKLTFERLPFARLFWGVNEEEGMRLLNRLKSFQSKDAAGRYDLLMMQNPSVFNYFSMLDISNYLGIKPETLSRLRKEKSNIRT